ncbi:MAG: hypothetical protein GY859_12170, partial [Desulfobacterales bacterium]|nr:hypothetical protein [Desulfobacterales bacterium]
GGLTLVLPEKRSYLLTIDFSTRVHAAPGKKYIDFQLPSAPLTRIDMTIPGEDLDVEIKPMLSKKIDVVGQNTEFTAFLSPAGKVNVSWLAKSLETKSAQSLIFANVFSEFFIKESVYALKSRVDFSVMQAKTDAFRLKIPSGMSLVRVDGKNIKDWETDKDGILAVTLYEKISGPYSLTVYTEKQRAPDEKTVDFPALEAADAKRVDGVIVIKTDPSLRVRVEAVERVVRIDPSEIRGKTTLKNLVASFRYLRESFLVRLDMERIKPRVTARQDILITFTDAIVDYDSRVHFNVRDAGVFEFKFLTPEGFRVVDVGSGDAVDDFSLTREKGREVLRVLLKKKAKGEFTLPVRLEADKEDKNISMALPKLTCVGVEKEEGVIALSLKKNLKLTTEGVKALRPIRLERLRTSRGRKQQGDDKALAAGWAYSTTDYACTLMIEKRKTKIIARVERNIHLEEAVLKINDVVRYNILYAPAGAFRLELPAPLGKEAVVTGDNIKEKRFI